MSSYITRNSDLNRIFDTAKYTYCFLSDQYTYNSSFFESRHRLKAQIKKKKQYAEFGFLSLNHENLVPISCFRKFLIFSQSYIFNFCIYWKRFFLLSFLSYNFFYRLYSPFCHHCTPFVIIWNSAESEICFISS